MCLSANKNKQSNPLETGETEQHLDRRTFIKATLASGGVALTLCQLPAGAETQEQHETTPSRFDFPFLILHPDNSITINNSRSEMGQGVTTTLAQYLIEELDADWDMIKTVQQSGADAKRFGHQNTIGAISSFIGWKVHRDAGAKLRQLLINTAADIWQVDIQALSTLKSFVVHEGTKQRISYGELAGFIKDATLPEQFSLKKPEQFKVIGTSPARLDLPEKINGKAQFGIDVLLPEMKTAVVMRPPVSGSKLKTWDKDTLDQQSGIIDSFAIEQGLVIVAESFWHANSARKWAAPTWLESEFAQVSSDDLMSKFATQLEKPEKQFNSKGEANQTLAMAKPQNRMELTFSFPLVAHATMEPMNCTAWFNAGTLHIWAPTQNRNDAKTKLQEVFDLKPDNIEFNTTLMGGGFGRRAQEDFVLEAAAIAIKTGDPIKVIWSREDDFRHDFFRPMNKQQLSVSVTEENKLEAWRHNIATLATSPFHFSLQDRNTDAGDWVAYGGAEDSLYDSAHFDCGVTLNKTPLKAGILRGISHGYTNFTREVMMSYLAQKLGVEPLQFRRKHIKNQRASNVLDKLAQLTAPFQADSNCAIGHAFGFEKAPQGPYQYYNAASCIFKKQQSSWELEKLIVVLDHGTVINPDGLYSQLQGAVIFALGIMLQNQITIHAGKVQQSNFHDYPLPRMGAQLPIDMHIVENTEWPMGVGEKLQGTIQPAIANALSKITNAPVTQLPISSGLLKQHKILLG